MKEWVEKAKMEEINIEDYKVKEGEEVSPIMVLTGTVAEFEEFCSKTGRNTKTAIAIRQGYQIPMYSDLPMALWGTFWLNAAYNSLEYKDRLHKVKMQELENMQ